MSFTQKIFIVTTISQIKKVLLGLDDFEHNHGVKD